MTVPWAVRGHDLQSHRNTGFIVNIIQNIPLIYCWIIARKTLDLSYFHRQAFKQFCKQNQMKKWRQNIHIYPAYFIRLQGAQSQRCINCSTLTCWCTFLAISLQTSRAGSTDEACWNMDALETLHSWVTRPSGAWRRFGPQRNLWYPHWCHHRFNHRLSFKTNRMYKCSLRQNYT